MLPFQIINIGNFTPAMVGPNREPVWVPSKDKQISQEEVHKCPNPL